MPVDVASESGQRGDKVRHDATTRQGASMCGRLTPTVGQGSCSGHASGRGGGANRKPLCSRTLPLYRRRPSMATIVTMWRRVDKVSVSPRQCRDNPLSACSDVDDDMCDGSYTGLRDCRERIDHYHQRRRSDATSRLISTLFHEVVYIVSRTWPSTVVWRERAGGRANPRPRRIPLPFGGPRRGKHTVRRAECGDFWRRPTCGMHATPCCQVVAAGCVIVFACEENY